MRVKVFLRRSRRMKLQFSVADKFKWIALEEVIK